MSSHPPTHPPTYPPLPTLQSPTTPSYPPTNLPTPSINPPTHPPTHLLPTGWGFNAATLTYQNLLECGVLDAATVTENSLQNSVSIASLVLTSGGMVVEDEDAMRRLEEQQQVDYAKAAGGMM